MGRKAKEVPCQCGKAECTVSTEIQLHADKLELPFASAAFILNMLKNTGNLAAGVAPGLNQAAGGLLVIINNLQDMAEVDGGFRRIVVDCCKLTTVVIRHLKKDKQKRLSHTVRDAIRELCVQVEEIRQFSTKMLERGRFKKFFLGQVDKAKVGDWRTRLTVAWDIFKTELLLDVAAGNSGNDKLKDEIANEIRKAIQELGQQGVQHSPPTQLASPETNPASVPPPNNNYQSPTQSHDPGYDACQNGQHVDYTVDGNCQPYHQDGYGWQGSQGGYQNYEPGGWQYQSYQRQDSYSDSGYSSNGYSSGYSSPDCYPYGYWNSPPQSYWTPPPSYHASRAPVNNIKNVDNANFGTNFGTLNQVSYT